MNGLKPVFFLILLFCQLAAKASGEKVDSLQSLLQNENLSPADSLSILNELGFELWTVDPSRSVQVGRKALNLALRLEEEEEVAYAYKVIGVAYWALGDYQLALDNMLQSLDRYKELHNEQGVGSMFLNIGLVYSEQLSYTQAKYYFRQAYAIFEKSERSRSQATALTKLATVLSFEDSLAVAKDYLNKAIELHRDNAYQYGLAEAYNRMGIVYRMEGDYNASLDYLYRSRDISNSIDDNEGLAKGFTDIGLTLMAMQRYSEAEDFFQQSLQKSRAIGSKKWRVEAYLGLSKLYEIRKEKDAALEYLKKYQSLKDSILDQQKILAIAHLQDEYENREQLRDLENSKLRIYDLQEQARSRTTLIVVISILFILLIAVISLAYRNQSLRAKRLADQKEQDLRLREIEEEKHAAELENIRLKQKELERELELRQRELASYALNFLQKNEFIADLRKDLQKVKSLPELQRVKRKLQSAGGLDKDWENFRMQFEKVHGNFADELKVHHPDLTQAELKLATLLRINLNTKECASILGISPESAKTARYRLRKKMNVDTEENLFDYLRRYGN